MDEAEHCDRIAIIDHGKLVVLDTPEALKQSVGQDRVEIRTSDDARSVEEISDRFGLEASMAEGSIRLYVPRGDEFVPRLFAELSTRIDSVNVARPTLDDVFMSYTGRTIRDAEATDTDRMAAFVRARRGRR
jgi:ABC-2 type transport system ATP-binding protein